MEMKKSEKLKRALTPTRLSRGKTDNELKKILKQADKLTIFDLPIGVYVVTKAGQFLAANKQVAQIFNLTRTKLLNTSITDFYGNPSFRETIVSRAESQTDTAVIKNILPLVVKGQEVFVQDYATALKNTKTGALSGFVGCIADVTQEERYKKLFDTLPVGVYQLNRDDQLMGANEALAKILGYESPDSLLGIPVKDFYVNPQEAVDFQALLNNEGSIVDHKVELRKKGGDNIFVSVSASKITTPDGQYGGREGTMMDVTTEERYRRMLEDVPVGLYEIRVENGEDTIRHCNAQYAAIHDFENREEAIGFNVKNLHASPQEYNEYISRLKELSRRDEAVTGYPLNIRSRKGRNFVLEVNSQLLKNRAGDIIGRVGVVRDITEEAGLRETVNEFRDDIGAVLHTYTSTLLALQHSLAPTMESLSPDPFPENLRLSPEQAYSFLAQPAEQLARAIARLISFSEEEQRSLALLPEDWDRLRRLREFLESHNEIELLELVPPALGEAALSALIVLKRVKPHLVSRDAVRNARQKAAELLRLSNLVALHLAKDVILEMDHQVRALREYVTSGARIKEPKTVCTVKSLISQVIQNLYQFANARGVRFDVHLESPANEVFIEQRQIVRALANLVHNAIKYSWQRTEKRASWISIRDILRGQQVHIQIESWGVPIPKDEIEQDLVFHIGFRGRLSSDRGRVGTGVGLTDARRVAKDHGGDVTIQSHPALPSAADDYTHPFLTTASLILPVHIKTRTKR
jgi:PAS domain S-box-containing protein